MTPSSPEPDGEGAARPASDGAGGAPPSSATAVEARPSKVAAVLAGGRRDIWISDPIVLPRLFEPVRDFVLDPVLAVSSVLLPPLLGERADAALAWCLSLALVPVGYVYGSRAAPPPDAADVDMRAAAKGAVLRAGVPDRAPKFRPPSDARSAFQGAVSFACSAAGDVVGVMANPVKMRRWFDALGQFKAYLDASGVGDELEEAMMKPLLYGRLLDNVKILNDIQEEVDADRCQKARCCDGADLDGEIEEGRRIMRFATAAYGTEMIRSAIDREVGPQELRDQKRAIACHTGVSPEDVRLMYAKDGADCHILHHFAAVDRKSKSIILALRGTLSLSGALVDIQGMDCDYCTGRAHKGIAEMAENVWKESGEAIKRLFEEEELRDYGLTITGHSLGAGTACLLNIKCHAERLVGGRLVRCYGFAPPPTFYLCGGGDDDDGGAAHPRGGRVDDAIRNCVAYVHDNDAVPFLSVASVRRLASLLDAVDNETERVWFWRRWRIFHEWEDIPREIFDSVAAAGMTGARAVDGACDLVIPARVVVWVKKNFAGKFEAIGCDPEKVARGTIFVCQDMVSDHLPEQYEDALDALVE